MEKEVSPVSHHCCLTPSCQCGCLRFWSMYECKLDASQLLGAARIDLQGLLSQQFALTFHVRTSILIASVPLHSASRLCLAIHDALEQTLHAAAPCRNSLISAALSSSATGTGATVQHVSQPGPPSPLQRRDRPSPFYASPTPRALHAALAPTPCSPAACHGAACGVNAHSGVRLLCAV